MYILAYDTETSGLPLFREPSDSPGQPHIVQLAAALVNTDTREIVQSLDVIIRPDGWEIPDEVAAIHGITTEKAQDVGISEETALSAFLDLWACRPRVAHNETFDQRVIRIAIKRFFGVVADTRCDLWREAPVECTARLSTSIVNLPPTEKMKRAGRNHPKTPKLSEAYEHFTGRPLENAHSAMADVLGCLEVYWAIKDQQEPEGEAA